jgi:glycosyltransferase involved in cell wall biosynthesis
MRGRDESCCKALEGKVFVKILLVSHFFPPDRIGGAEKIALNYAVHLQNLGHKVQVVAAGDWDAGDHHWNGITDETYQGISVRRVNLNWNKADDPNKYLYDNPVTEHFFEEWLTLWEPDIVHIVSLITLSASIIRPIKKRGIPVVFTLVDFWLVCPKNILVRHDQSLCSGQTSGWDCTNCLMQQSKMYRGAYYLLREAGARPVFQWASRHWRISKNRGLRGMALNMTERKQILTEIARQVDFIAAPSAFLGRTIEETGLVDRKIPVIPYGHDLSWLESMPQKSPSSTVRVGYIGQIIHLKGLHVLIAAFLEAEAGSSARLKIYGSLDSDPHYAAQLKSMAGDSGSIEFMGAYTHDRLGEILSDIDVLVVPSQWHENNPLVVQEAFASKTPVIGSNVGGISEFVHHDINGLLFHYTSVAELKTALQQVIFHPEVLERFRTCIEPVKDIHDEVNQYVAVYQQLRDRIEN